MSLRAVTPSSSLEPSHQTLVRPFDPSVFQIANSPFPYASPRAKNAGMNLRWWRLKLCLQVGVVYLAGSASWRSDSVIIDAVASRRKVSLVLRLGFFSNYIFSTKSKSLFAPSTPLPSSGLKNWVLIFPRDTSQFSGDILLLLSGLIRGRSRVRDIKQPCPPFCHYLVLLNMGISKLLCLGNSACHCAAVLLLVISHFCVLVPSRGSIWKVKVPFQFQERALANYGFQLINLRGSPF